MSKPRAYALSGYWKQFATLSMAVSGPLNLYDFEALARSRMDPGAYDDFADDAADELTVSENCRACRRIVLRPRVMVNVSVVDASTRLLGRRC